MLERCPTATLCLDPYHVVALASSALDEVRREVWQQARRAGDTTGARWLKGARWALWKRPERLTDRQQAKLATIEHVNRRLYRAYLLKEQLRLVFHSEPDEAVALLEAWLVWARRCRIASFIKLAKTITTNKAGIVATLTHRLSNARIEAINTTLRLISRRAYGTGVGQLDEVVGKPGVRSAARSSVCEDLADRCRQLEPTLPCRGQRDDGDADQRERNSAQDDATKPSHEGSL